MISKSPKLKDNCLKKVYFTTEAREGWFFLLKQLDIRSPFKILLPSYIGYTEREGSGVMDPVNQTDTEFDFYEINGKLGFDFNKFETMIKSRKYKLALVIHYFGFLEVDIKRIAKLCRENNVLLVEDCAHAMLSSIDGNKLGSFGDFSFFSIHKILSTNTGGILQVNNSSFNFQGIPDKADYNVLEQYFRSDFLGIAKKRRENYNYMLGKIKGINKIEVMFSALKEGIVPHNFPIIVKDELREKLYFYLMEHNIPTIALYYQLFASINEDSFPISYKISKNILNLPVHQDVTFRDIDLIVKIIEQGFGELK